MIAEPKRRGWLRIDSPTHHVFCRDLVHKHMVELVAQGSPSEVRLLRLLAEQRSDADSSCLSVDLPNAAVAARKAGDVIHSFSGVQVSAPEEPVVAEQVMQLVGRPFVSKILPLRVVTSIPSNPSSTKSSGGTGLWGKWTRASHVGFV